MFHGSMGDVISRSWHGFFTGSRNDRGDTSHSLYLRLPAALRGEGRSPGIDIISRAGTVTYEPIAGAGRQRVDSQSPVSAIVIREMTLQVHAVVEHASDLYATIVVQSVQEEMTWMTNSPDHRFNTVATVP